MRTRIEPLVGILVFSLAACERDPSSPVAKAKDLKSNLAVNFERETHFRCYVVSSQTPEPATIVTLDDQFQAATTLTVDEPLEFCAPTSKNGLPILAPEEHLTMYGAPQELPQHILVSTEDQFGPRTLEVVGARVLLVPTQKLVGELEFPTKLNHYWCYQTNGERVGEPVSLDDQFSASDVRVQQPVYFCNPVTKTVGGVTTPIEEQQVHLTCYDIKGPQKTNAQEFNVFNQFETDLFTVTSWDILCVPSAKLGYEVTS
jgi:hypothetical protein